MGAAHDDLGLGMGDERALDCRNVYSLPETNVDGVFSRAVMPNPSVGI